MRFTLVSLVAAALLSSVLAAPTAACKAICQNECKAVQLKEGLECGPSDTRHCARTVESNAYNCNYLCETSCTRFFSRRSSSSSRFADVLSIISVSFRSCRSRRIIGWLRTHSRQYSRLHFDSADGMLTVFCKPGSERLVAYSVGILGLRGCGR